MTVKKRLIYDRLQYEVKMSKELVMNKILLVPLIGVIMLLITCNPSSNKWQKLHETIEVLIENSGGTVAVAFEDLKTGDKLFINEKIQMHAASTMKTPVMIEVFKQASQGRFKLSDSLLVKNEFKSIVDGSSYSMDISDDSDDQVYQKIDQKMSIRDLIYHTITSSSNLATNILVDLVDAKNVMKTMKGIGANQIQVLRGVEDNKAYQLGLNNITDAYDMLLVMKTIALKQVVSEAACDEMIEILADQKFSSKIPALLPREVTVAHKTGSITAIDHDAAIVYKTPDHPYILVVLTKGIEDHKKAEELIAKISKLIYDVN